MCVKTHDSRVRDLVGSTNRKRRGVAKADTAHVEPSAVGNTKTRLFNYIDNFATKNWKFSDKNYDIFQISAKNIDCGYSLEPPRRGGSNEYPQSMFLNRNKKNNV